MWLWRRSEANDGGVTHLVVGLGNPGGRYADTRHNAGFMVVNRLAQRHGGSLRSRKHRADTARIDIDGTRVLLAQPVTYMNESGQAVQRLLHYFRVPLERLLVVCDEMDLPFGTVRLRPEGSAGGNRGLQSVVQCVGSERFARLRVGVGRPPGEAKSHVLAPFQPEQRRLLEPLIDTCARACEAWIQRGVEPAMNAYNRDWLPELSAEP